MYYLYYYDITSLKWDPFHIKSSYPQTVKGSGATAKHLIQYIICYPISKQMCKIIK
jgi:hypothetical protein